MMPTPILLNCRQCYAIRHDAVDCVVGGWLRLQFPELSQETAQLNSLYFTVLQPMRVE